MPSPSHGSKSEPASLDEESVKAAAAEAAPSSKLTELGKSPQVPKKGILSAAEHVKRLRKLGPIKDYKRIPNDIKEYINKNASKVSVQCGAIYQSPEDFTELQIIGINATSMHLKWEGYKFSVKESKGFLHHVECSRNRLFLVKRYVMKGMGSGASGQQQENMWGHPERQCPCGMIIHGQCGTSFQREALFVLVPAHIVMGNKLDMELVVEKRDIDMEQLVRQVSSMATRTMYTLNINNRPQKRDLQSLPIFAFRHFTTGHAYEEAEEYMEFTNDAAILELDPCDERSGDIKEADLKRAMTKYFHQAEGSVEQPSYKIENIFPLQTQDLLTEMSEQRTCLIIGPAQIKGHMVPCGQPLTSGGVKWTLAIEFVITDEDRALMDGDSGTILYVQDNAAEGDIYPIGMFIGESLRKHECGQTVYRAVVLKTAILELENENLHLVQKLHPLDADCNRPEDGPEMAQNLRRHGQEDSSSSSNCFSAADSGRGTMQSADNN